MTASNEFTFFPVWSLPEGEKEGRLGADGEAREREEGWVDSVRWVLPAHHLLIDAVALACHSRGIGDIILVLQKTTAQ